MVVNVLFIGQVDGLYICFIYHNAADATFWLVLSKHIGDA